MGDMTAELERMQDEANVTWDRWRTRADYWHNTSLDPDVWTVDGEAQAEPLTEETLNAALLREGPNRKVVEVGAPLHLVLGRIIGRMPPYR